MSVFKEGFYTIELIEKNSRQIYPDAADYGMLIKRGDKNWNWVKQLTDWYGLKHTRTVTSYETGQSVSQVVRLLNEHGDGSEIKYWVHYVTVDGKGPTKGFDGLVYIEKIEL